MSVDYDLVCHKHRDRVSICSDGCSGPLLQCDKSLAAFVITHEKCVLAVLNEHNEDFHDYREFDSQNWKDCLDYSIDPK